MRRCEALWRSCPVALVRAAMEDFGRVSTQPGVIVEFELVWLGTGSKRRVMIGEPGGTRIEFDFDKDGFEMTTCTHLDQVHVTDTTTTVCEDCVKLGGHWLHLRMCLTCGHVGCCDSSPNRHATRHFHATHHPLVRSIEPGEKWMWCYRDGVVAGEVA